jgi:NADH:ubiquinone oxidoreductase subunit F (NADH-binding)/(2Fe-2S) ferredoxin/Pyruvate/2-oxoacid:ferredoxin oxidoreductase delta subunit
MRRGEKMAMKVTSIKDLDQLKTRGLGSLYPGATRVAVGTATCGIISGALEVMEALKAAAQKAPKDFIVMETGCVGFCQEEPIVSVMRPKGPMIFYSRVSPEIAGKILEAASRGEVVHETVLGKIMKEDYILGGAAWAADPKHATEEEKKVKDLSEHPFYKRQVKIVLRNCGFIDPDSIEEYIAKGGYYTAFNVLAGKVDPEKIIGQVSESGLRGRGGGGFPAGRKWQSCRAAPGEPKYVICNADEGDPGAYMDRSVLEGDPHCVIEGMIIGAHAIGATGGYIYVRHEYPLAVKRFRHAVSEARAHGFLGNDIFGTGNSFDITIVKGGGAFVCGESSALMASLEGKVGEPRAKFIHTVESGVWSKPSNLNNVETWANIPPIVDRGAGWFKSMGTEGSKGTKVFSLVGKVKRTGLVEVPMGITLREMIYEVGGGSPAGREFKAVQTGGPSGGAIPVLENGGGAAGAGKSLIDLPVDFDALAKAGSMMGSGGMIVMDEDTCMVDVARYFTTFLVDESCGKCSSCREGLIQMSWILRDICEGKGEPGHIGLLERLASMVNSASLCQLGGTAANPLLSTLKYFGAEYEEHIKEHVCRALVCKALLTYSIDEDKCTACRLCEKDCPTGAIAGDKNVVHTIDRGKCIQCGVCFDVCKYGAVSVSSGKYRRTSEHTKTNLKPVKQKSQGATS